MSDIDKKLLEDFGFRLRQRRTEFMRLTQNELSEMLGCTEPYVSLMERGKRKPSGEMAQKISDITGLSCWALEPVFDWSYGR